MTRFLVWVTKRTIMYFLLHKIDTARSKRVTSSQKSFNTPCNFILDLPIIMVFKTTNQHN